MSEKSHDAFHNPSPHRLGKHQRPWKITVGEEIVQDATASRFNLLPPPLSRWRLKELLPGPNSGCVRFAGRADPNSISALDLELIFDELGRSQRNLAVSNGTFGSRQPFPIPSPISPVLRCAPLHAEKKYVAKIRHGSLRPLQVSQEWVILK